ncbi:hypothetical protein Cgig2_009178 [Carnegiea gigantea]|uniref:Replication protein A 70 kDa DNA-binding subunit B/D first OB fold domain-containing protein n=1 Tax=Carnegiea gigantea TaxID=171969 RepID=A0A9Q1QH90_9CARY|nr:hypothetical protein Cgig2_009178 [Carnegiea gigantea]
MAPTRKSFKELNDKTQYYTVKVKVIKKTHEMISPNKTRYQRICFQDDEVLKRGAKMQAAIFDGNVAHYDKTVKFGKECDISNARIKCIKEQHCTPKEEYKIEFVDTTFIKPLSQSSNSDDSYTSRCRIRGQRDVLGIVLYVGMLRTLCLPSSSSEAREVVGFFFIRCICCILFLLFHERNVNKLAGLLDPISIIGLTALKGSSHKVDPEGDKAKSLTQWY